MECQQKHENMFEYTTQPFSGCLNLGMISNDFESGSSLVKWGMGRSTYVCSTRLALWASVKVVKEYMPHMVEFDLQIDAIRCTGLGHGLAVALTYPALHPLDVQRIK